MGLEGLTGTGVIVLVPLTRAQFAASRGSLPNWDAELPRVRPAFLDIRATSTPRDLLLSRLFRPIVLPEQPGPEEPWRQLVRDALSQRLLWYVRRRHLPIPTNVAGTAASGDSSSVRDPERFNTLLDEDATIAERFNVLRRIETPEVNALTRRLTETRFVDNPALLRSVLVRATEPETGGATVTPERALAGLAAVTDPALGQGLARLEAENATLGRTLATNRVADTGTLAEIDRLARDVPTERLGDLATELRTAVRAGENITDNLAALRRRLVP
jgi:hypothetical protein